MAIFSNIFMVHMKKHRFFKLNEMKQKPVAFRLNDELFVLWYRNLSQIKFLMSIYNYKQQYNTLDFI